MTFPLFKVEPTEADLSLTDDQKELLVKLMLDGSADIFRNPNHNPYLIVRHAGFDTDYHQLLASVFENLLARPVDIKSMGVNGRTYECVRLVTFRMAALMPWYNQFKETL